MNPRGPNPEGRRSALPVRCGDPVSTGVPLSALTLLAAMSGCASETFVSTAAVPGAISGALAVAFLGVGGGVLAVRGLRCALSCYHGLRPVPRDLLRRLVMLFVLGGGTELLLDALGVAGVDPLAIGLVCAALYVLLLRGLVLLVRDAQAAVEAWCEREAQRLVAGFVRAIGSRASDASRARGAAVTPPDAARLAVPRERHIEAGPTCWICGGVNDGHRH